MSAIDIAREHTRLLKLKKDDLYDEAVAFLRRVRELEAQAVEKDKELYDMTVRALAAESCSRLHKLWWKQAVEKFHRARWEYHAAMMKLAGQEVEEAKKESQGE